MEEINKLYEEVKDIEILVTDFTKTKNDLKSVQNEIRKIELHSKDESYQETKNKIQNLENKHLNIVNEIKKIDLFTKDYYNLIEIEAMFEFIADKKILIEKCLNFLNSLVYSLFINKNTVAKIFNPCRFVDFTYKDGTYKIIKINKDLNDFFGKIKEDILQKCYVNFYKIMKEELENCLISDITMFYDKSYFYLLFWIEESEESCDNDFFASVEFIQTEFLSNLKNISEIFFEIFKNNLCYKLLKNELFESDLLKANSFFENSEFFITNFVEWKLDCIMKKIIELSKNSKSGKFVKTQHEKISQIINKAEKKYLPEFISKELYEFLLCFNIFNSLKSKRAKKASKIIEKALLKLISHDNMFIEFSDASFCARIFCEMSISGNLMDKRETLYSEIIKKNAELTKNLQDSSLALKVYFKRKHFDFIDLISKFVPPNNQTLFEIDFFDILYINVMNTILCINYVDNDLLRNIADVLQYLIDMPNNIPKENIASYEKIQSYYLIFTNDIEEINKLYKRKVLFIDKTDLQFLLKLIFYNRN